MIKLWGRLNSSNVQKVVFALEELGLAYEHENRGGAFGGVDSPEYLAMNPNGLVPALRDGDLTLWESSAIVRYLAAQYGAGTLSPADAKQRALADQWSDWVSTTLQPQGWLPVFVQVVRTAPAMRDPALVDAAVANAVRLYGILDRHLAGRRWMLGDTFSYADVMCGAGMYRWTEMPIERPSMPNLEAWHARLKARPAYVKGVEVSFADMYAK